METFSRTMLIFAKKQPAPANRHGSEKYSSVNVFVELQKMQPTVAPS
jgi:hypothetical protein